MKQVFENIPDCFFEKLVGFYTFYKGKAIATVDDLNTAIINYSHKAAQNN